MAHSVLIVLASVALSLPLIVNPELERLPKLLHLSYGKIISHFSCHNAAPLSGHINF